MDEFIKLGGYLVEGQPEVAHDSALSGNGLEDSPLGISQQFITDVVNSASQSALSARSASTALYDENGNPITGYQVAGDYYSASNPSGFITGVDLTPYQTVEGMTAYQSAGDYLTTGDSANFYTTANESGFITGVPAGTMNESAFGYDASDNITGYNGSAFKAGDEFPQSATEAIETVTANSADWNGTTETVSSNSGTWGGSALPISAGPGIKFEMVDNTLVASTDETLLFSGSNAWGYGTITLSESLKNFKRIKVLATRAFTADGNTDRYSGPWSEFECDGIANTTAAWGAVTPVIYEGPFWKFSTFTANSTFTELNWFEGGYIKVTNPSEYAAGSTWNDGKSCGIKAVIGINRIAGGN